MGAPEQHFAFNYDAATGKHEIPIAVDRRYRQGLWRAAEAGGAKVAWFIHRALRNGPSRNGADETIAYYGGELTAMMHFTAPTIDALEIAMPGFKQWLVVTGFGNDLTMFKGMVRWAEARATVGDVPASAIVPQPARPLH
jgi:hypothetical protein